LNQSREEAQRWLNEVFSDQDYQCSNISDGGSNEDDEENDAAEVDVDEEAEDHEYVSVQNQVHTILSVNARNNYFQTLKFRYRGRSSRSEAAFVRKLANWLDKLTEGLCKEKTHVSEWPAF
jgi:hypothetical protein